MATINTVADPKKLIEKAEEVIAQTTVKCTPFKESRKLGYANLKKLTEAAENGEVTAQFELGERYFSGFRLDINYELAEKYLKMAADQNHAKAHFILAKINERKPRPSYSSPLHNFLTGVESCPADPNYIEPEMLLQKAADLGCPEAQLQIGHRYLYKRIGNGEDGYDWLLRDGTEHDSNPGEIEIGWEWIFRAADNGSHNAMFELAERYSEGHHTTPNFVEAAKWYKRAAETGDAYGSYKIGLCYEEGKGVKQDKRLAAKWYAKGAKKSHPHCQYKLGLCYAKGEGMQENPALAFKWMLDACTKNFFPKAEYEIGNFYYNGKMVKADTNMALKWWLRAANHKNLEAQLVVSHSYWAGDGIEKNLEEAKRWEIEAENTRRRMLFYPDNRD